MESFKIEHFEKEYPGQSFPAFRTLTPSETERIRHSLSRLAGLPDTVDKLHLIKHLDSLAKPYPGANAKDEDFDLLAVVEHLAIKPQETILVNWYRYDRIDELRLDDLASHFDDIWYPSSDDIEIFDSTLSWMLLVAHDGTVALLDLAPDSAHDDGQADPAPTS